MGSFLLEGEKNQLRVKMDEKEGSKLLPLR